MVVLDGVMVYFILSESPRNIVFVLNMLNIHYKKH